MKLRIVFAALAGASLVPMAPSSAEDYCPALSKARGTVSVLDTFTYAEEHAMVVFKDVPLNVGQDHHAVDVIVCVSCRKNLRVKVNRSLVSSVLAVTIWGCDYEQGRIYEVWGSEATLYVTSDAEKSRWNKWVRDYVKAEKREQEEARQKKAKPLVLPPIDS